jgi:hypothetical protein
MSTHECFEKHRSLARDHEDQAKQCVEELDGGLQALGKAVAKKAMAQQRLAVREYKEARRLRPRDSATRRDLQAAMRTLRALQSVAEEPKRCALRRFLAHYNLSLRYWDLGKANQAIYEAGCACDELLKEGLPTGCAEQNRALMEKVQMKYRSEQQRLLAAVRTSPQAIGPNYQLGILYFDKRMMLQAESQLRWTRDLAKTASSLKLLGHDRQLAQSQEKAAASPVAALLASASPSLLEAREARERISGVLADLEDDLEYIGTLRSRWCVEAEAGKTDEFQELGIRDGSRPQVLPSLHSRYEQSPEDCEACGRWWAELCSRGDFGESEPPPKPIRPRSSSGYRSDQLSRSHANSKQLLGR